MTIYFPCSAGYFEAARSKCAYELNLKETTKICSPSLSADAARGFRVANEWLCRITRSWKLQFSSWKQLLERIM